MTRFVSIAPCFPTQNVGTPRNDFISTGSRNDTIDAGAGSDTVFAGAGNDTLIYRVGENKGARDFYDGGVGRDTLRLELTGEEWASKDVQADVARFLSHLGAWYNALPNCLGLSLPFCFSAFGLKVTGIEKLEVVVDGVVLNPFDEAVTARADLLVVTESAGGSVDLLANDAVPDRAAQVQLLSPSTLGTVSLLQTLLPATQTAVLGFTPGASLEALRAGEIREEVISYRVTDVDGDTSVSTVKIRVIGENDRATIATDGVQDVIVAEQSCSTGGDLVASGKLLVSDVDGGEAVLATPAAPLTVVGAVSTHQGQFGTFTVDAATGAWSYALQLTAAQEASLGEDDVALDTLTVFSLDGTASFDVTVKVVGGQVLTFADGTTVIDGTDGDDVVKVGTGNQAVLAGAGDDWIETGAGDDTICGGAGNDRITGEGGNDSILGGDGDDTIFGVKGSDTIYGGFGNDRILGSVSSDFLSGGFGDDLFVYKLSDYDATATDTIRGGEGTDEVRMEANLGTDPSAALAAIEATIADYFASDFETTDFLFDDLLPAIGTMSVRSVESFTIFNEDAGGQAYVFTAAGMFVV